MSDNVPIRIRLPLIPAAALPSPTLEERTPARIAVFQALNLGDLLCATPALRALRCRYPDAEITLIGLPWAREFAERLPAIDRWLPFPGYPGIFESPTDAPAPLASWPKFDLAIQMHGSGEISNGFVASLGARRSIGFGPRSDDRLTTVFAWEESEPEPLRWLRLAAAAGATADGFHLDCPLSDEDCRTATTAIGPPDGRLVIGLHAGASDPARRWPTEQFAKLGDMLAEHYNARVVLTGAETDGPLTASVQHAMRARAIDLAGHTSLGEFAAVISALDLLVTNDTGASHLAAATRTPSVVLFGPTRPSRWAPLDRQIHQIIDATSCPDAPPDGATALQRLSGELVFAACCAAICAAPYPVAQPVDQEQLAWAG